MQGATTPRAQLCGGIQSRPALPRGQGSGVKHLLFLCLRLNRERLRACTCTGSCFQEDSPKKELLATLNSSIQSCMSARVQKASETLGAQKAFLFFLLGRVRVARKVRGPGGLWWLLLTCVSPLDWT